MPFKVYKSSAGSGKTFTLVREYIILALKKPDQFRHILAITFTNKAAGEMKERIIHYLRELSADTPDINSVACKFLLPDIIKETNLNEKEIFFKARQVLNSILHNYSDFAICTIDSFVHRIIRSFAHDLKIPLNFEVEMDIEKIISEAIDLLISKVGTDELLTKILVEFTEAKTDDEKSWHIENDLQTFAKQLFKEDNFLHLEKIRSLSISDFLEIRKKIVKLISFFENEITKTSKEAKELIAQNNISIESFYQGNKGIGTYFENLANGNFDKIIPNSYVTASIEQDKWYAGKADAVDKAKIDTIKDQLINIYQDIEKLKEKQYKNYILYKLIFANIYPVAVLNEIEKIIEEIKIEDNILPISEFNRMISKVVISQPVPFIYERIGEKYQNYMVDEFQDTSVLQWMNMLPLIENSLSYDQFNMIVGDGKQAIYRFRGGDVEQFALLPKLPAEIADQFSLERAAAISRNYTEKNLSSNFRSKAEIIDFNNKFFSHILENSSPYIKSIYDKCTQEFNPENTGGCIQLDFIRKDDTENYNDISLNKITEILQELIEHNFSFRDIAILCRSNMDASNIAKHLLINGVNVISEESLLINGSENVSFLLALASFISNTDNEIAKYRVLYYLLKNNFIQEKDIYSLGNKLKKDNNESDKTIHTNIFIKYLKENNFNFILTSLSAKPVFELFE
ncbi:MAG: UvrD-helicase domain-containing protein, partial [Bacteroidetes bacterium]|nr:UvrD-helicase domain-containing protein [Bacteroidota bacterium]